MESRTCFKCGVFEGTQVLRRGVLKPVRILTHHISYNPEKIVNCCDSCHKKIHVRIRKNNACPYSVEETDKISQKSSMKRSTRHIEFYNQLAPDVRLEERIVYNINTGNVTCIASFFANHGKQLYREDI